MRVQTFLKIKFRLHGETSTKMEGEIVAYLWILWE